MTRHAGWIKWLWAAAHTSSTATSGSSPLAARLPPASAGEASAAGCAAAARFSMLQGSLPQPVAGPSLGRLSLAWPRRERAGMVIPSKCSHQGQLRWCKPLWLHHAGGQMPHQKSLPGVSRTFCCGAVTAHSAQPGRAPTACGSSRRLFGSVAGRSQGVPAPQAQPAQSSRAVVQGRARSAAHKLPRSGTQGKQQPGRGARLCAVWPRAFFGRGC